METTDWAATESSVDKDEQPLITSPPDPSASFAADDQSVNEQSVNGTSSGSSNLPYSPANITGSGSGGDANLANATVRARVAASPTRSKFNITQNPTDQTRFKTLDGFPSTYAKAVDKEPGSKPQLTVEAAVFRDQPVFQADKPTSQTGNKSGSDAPPTSRANKPQRIKKHRKRAHVTPTEIFAQNLSEAVLDADVDSDDHEAFVYSRSGPFRPQLPNQWLPSEGHDYREKLPPQRARRPVLRSAVSDLPPSTMRPLYTDAPPLPAGRAHTHSEWFPSDEESPLLGHKRPSSLLRRDTSQMLCRLLTLFFGLSILWGLFLIFFTGPLSSVEAVHLTNVLGTQKQLMFDLHVRARNGNWWTLYVSQGDVSVFASSRYVPTTLFNASDAHYERAAEPAEFLATIDELTEPLAFSSATWGRPTTSTAVSQIQIKNPGATNDDRAGNERWSLLIRYPYELTIRGVLKYRILPMIGQYHSARICLAASVDPQTGKVSPVPPSQASCSADAEGEEE